MDSGDASQTDERRFHEAAKMNDLKVALLDLNHTTRGLHTSTMPLGIGLLGAYLLEKLPKGSINLKLYKFTDDITADLLAKFDVIGFSMYAWNTNLNRFYAERIKRNNPQSIVVCGGPNITYRDEWIREFLVRNPFIDYLVPFNGERPLHSIVKAELSGDGRDKQDIHGVYYLEGNERSLVYKEPREELETLDEAPSPYLTGLMDQFFPSHNNPFKLGPFIETNRGCPYQCTFCHSSHRYYNNLLYKSIDTLRAEIGLFAEKMKNYPDIPLYIADNNFGMFDRDDEIADIMREHQDVTGWPVLIDVTVGKSRVDTILKVVKKLKPGTVSVFMSAQSMTPEVLKNIKRKNLSPEAFQYLQEGLYEAAEDGSSKQHNPTSSGLIIGLPGETRQSFFDTVEKIIGLGIDGFIPYTLMVLRGTPLGDEINQRLTEYTVKHRIVPQQFGKYEGSLILDTEEVAVATPTMSYADYLECRSLCFFLQVVYGNDVFRDVMHILKARSCSVFKWLLDIMDAVRSDNGKLGVLFQSFYSETQAELWDSEKSIYSFFENDENYKALTEGKYGSNILGKYTFLSRMECFDDWVEIIFRVTRDTLIKKASNEAEKGEINEFLVQYREYWLKVKNIARFFEAGFTLDPFLMELKYDFNNLDFHNPLKADGKAKSLTFGFSDTSRAIIDNVKRDKNWRYKLQQIIRIKNGAEQLYPVVSSAR